MDTGCFNISAIINNATMNIGMHVYLVELVCLFYSGKYIEVKLLDPMVFLLVTTSEMTQNIQDTQETDRTPLWPEEQNWAN